MLTSDQNRKINEIVEEFKEAADFYRMEYSEDLMGMFRDFGCMLLLKCKVDTEGKADLERLLEGRHKLKGTVKRQLMTVSEELVQLWAPGEQDGSGDTGEYEGSQNVREMFQTALEEIFHFCLYSKGGKVRRLYIPKSLRSEASLWLKRKGVTSGYLFLNRFGQRITTRGIAQQLKHFADKYGLNRDVVYPHSFRHRFAKNFLDRFNDLALLADLMGHESIETTRIYLRRTASEQQKIVDKVVNW